MPKLDEFNNKSVLLVCAETFSWPMHYVAEKIRPACLDISAIYIQPAESYFNRPEYRSFKEMNKDIHIYEMSSIVTQYLDKHKNAKDNIDWKYINKIERVYTKYSSLNEQLISEMTLLPYFHDRDYYEVISYDSILLYVQIYYQYIERLFSENAPDIILDCDVDFFGRAVLLEVSSVHNIPYISIDYGRIDSYVLPTLSLGKSKCQHFEYSYNCNLQDKKLFSDTKLDSFYKETIGHIGGIPSIYQKMNKDGQFSNYKMLKRVLIKTAIFVKNISIKQLKINLIDGVNSPICSSLFKRFKYMQLYFFRRFYLEYSNIFDKLDLTKINYVYLPLHVIPESSTTVLSPYYINEEFIIESLSKAVRPDQYVVVKEHWSMIGYRPISFYSRIKKIPNVVLIDPNTYATPEGYVSNSDLVVTISGTTALEASFIGVNSLIFADVVYELLSSVKKISITPQLREVVSKHARYKMPKRELYAYLKILLTWGLKVNIKNLLIHPSKANKNKVSKDVNNLLMIFSNGIKLHLKKKEKNEV